MLSVTDGHNALSQLRHPAWTPVTDTYNPSIDIPLLFLLLYLPSPPSLLASSHHTLNLVESISITSCYHHYLLAQRHISHIVLVLVTRHIHDVPPNLPPT